MRAACICFVFMLGMAYGDVIERGKSALRRWQGTLGSVSVMEGHRLARALSVTGDRQAIPALSGVLPASCGDLGDALLFLRRGGLNGPWRACQAACGGWCAEAGGFPEITATLAALGVLFDCGAEDTESLASGVDYVRSWLGKVVDWDDNAREAYGMEPEASSMGRLRLESLVVLALGRRQCLLDGGAELELETMVREELASFLGRIEDAFPADAGIYDVALLVRAAKLLGFSDAVAMLEGILLAAQHDDGTWSDRTAAGALVVTCAAVEALSGDARSIPSGKDIFMSFQGDAGATEAEDGSVTQGNLAFLLPDGLADGALVSVCVRDDAGRTQAIVWNGIKADTLFVRTDSLEPGTHEAIIRVWDDSGNVQAHEERKAFIVCPWFRLETLEAECLGLPEVLLSGRDMTLKPAVEVHYGCNEAQAATVSVSLTGPDGHILAVSDELRLVMASRGGCASVDFPPMALSAVSEGDYMVAATMRLGEESFTASTWFYVSASSDISVENYLNPCESASEVTEGTVVLNLRVANVSAQTGIASGFDGVSGTVSDRAGGGYVDILLAGIVSGDGRQLESGWLMLKSDYGCCSGGERTGYQPVGGSVTIHEIRGGQCRFRYCGNGKGLHGTVPVRVHAVAVHGDVLECKDEIGVVEINLEEGT